ncbi:MAG: tetratricopeptide repeat protein [Pseudomonadales bacterium]
MTISNQGSDNFVAEVDAQNFQAVVIEKSQQVPVILEFYAQGAAPSEALTAILSNLVQAYQGKIFWARVNVQTNPQIVQQLGVRGLPTIKIIREGQLLESLEGPQTEEQLRAHFDQLTMSPSDQIRAQIAHFVSLGDRESAMDMLREMMSQEPNNFSLHTELCDLMIQTQRIEEAETLLASLPNDAEGIEKARSRMYFVKFVQDLAPLNELARAAAEAPSDQDCLFKHACALVVDDQIEAALEVLLKMLGQDKTWQEDAARNTMIKVFELLGKGDPMASRYRRRMFTLLH